MLNKTKPVNQEDVISKMLFVGIAFCLHRLVSSVVEFAHTPLLRVVLRAQLRVDPQARSSMWEDLSRSGSPMWSADRLREALGM